MAILISLLSRPQIPKNEIFILAPNRWRCFQCEVLPIAVSTLNMYSLCVKLFLSQKSNLYPFTYKIINKK